MFTLKIGLIGGPYHIEGEFQTLAQAKRAATKAPVAGHRVAIIIEDGAVALFGSRWVKTCPREGALVRGRIVWR